jgi:hypothetical protein
MKQSEFFSRGLPKWPALIVQGTSVTAEQAMEIIVRTDSMRFSSNDGEFDRKLNEFFYDIQLAKSGYDEERDAILRKLGMDKEDKNSWSTYWEYQDKYRNLTGQIELEYLNNYRIVSSWVGGPHGWCNWDGTIGCNNFNIGKWPSVEDIYKEWKSIAKAFPFLDLRCQLMNHEADCEESVEKPGPVIEFRVKNGKVKMSTPTKPLAKTSFGVGGMYENLFQPLRERGCTFQQFQKAVTYTRDKIAGKIW